MRRSQKPLQKFYTLFGLLFALIVFGLAVITLVLPDSDYSASEKRSLAKRPEFTLASVADGSFMDGIEDWQADQFPFRDKLMAAKAQITIWLGNIRSQDVYLCKDGSMAEAFTMPDQAVWTEQARAMADFAARYPDAKAYYLLSPTAISASAEKLPKETLTDDQNLYINGMKEIFGSVGTFLDVRDTFARAKADTQLFYLTDHHWTTDAAYLAWQQLYEAMGLESQVTYTPGVVSNTFSGSLASASGFPVSKKDAVKIYVPGEDQMPVYTVTYGTSQKMTASVFEPDKLYTDDPYQIFFGGNHASFTIRTSVETDRKLLILKDSYANCLIPFLIPDFAEITVIDPRYYYDDLDMEMQSAGYTDILFLYNVNTLSEDSCLVPVLRNEQ